MKNIFTIILILTTIFNPVQSAYAKNHCSNADLVLGFVGGIVGGAITSTIINNSVPPPSQNVAAVPSHSINTLHVSVIETIPIQQTTTIVHQPMPISSIQCLQPSPPQNVVVINPFPPPPRRKHWHFHHIQPPRRPHCPPHRRPRRSH